MKGDYYRYMCEHQDKKNKNLSVNGSNESYRTATHDHACHLQAVEPIRLGLALNHSVYYYEILKQPDIAVKLAKKAFDDAINEIDEIDESKYNDAAPIMQLIRDNLTLWTSDLDQKQDESDSVGVREAEAD